MLTLVPPFSQAVALHRAEDSTQSNMLLSPLFATFTTDISGNPKDEFFIIHRAVSSSIHTITSSILLRSGDMKGNGTPFKRIRASAFPPLLHF